MKCETMSLMMLMNIDEFMMTTTRWLTCLTDPFFYVTSCLGRWILCSWIEVSISPNNITDVSLLILTQGKSFPSSRNFLEWINPKIRIDQWSKLIEDMKKIRNDDRTTLPCVSLFFEKNIICRSKLTDIEMISPLMIGFASLSNSSPNICNFDLTWEKYPQFTDSFCLPSTSPFSNKKLLSAIPTSWDIATIIVSTYRFQSMFLRCPP
jgi:hypothetical protein